MLANSPHVIALPEFTPPNAVSESSIPQAIQIAKQWLIDLESICNHENPSIRSKFRPDGWWRDHLALSWDLRTLTGVLEIDEYLQQHQTICRTLRNVRPRDSGKFTPVLKANLRWIESMFDFETDVGRGSGIVRLVQDGPGKPWLCYAISTTLLEVKGSEETIGLKRAHGGDNSLTSLPGHEHLGSWQDHREWQNNFLDNDPIALVVGAGQSGLSVAARLEQMGIPTLVIDKNKRIGDNWRHRYRTLVTHDPVHYCHLPYVPNPVNWPMFTPKDKLGDWLEYYASIMELNVWMLTTIKSASFDDPSSTWSIEIQKCDGSTRLMHPRHVIWSTGHSGEPKIPTFPGQYSFKGKIYHASEHLDASDMFPSDAIPLSQKKILVIGTGNSGHDIAQNYYEAGAQSVTMLQRAPTHVINSKIGYADMHKGLYDESLLPVPSLIEETDVYAQSLPIPVQFAQNVSKTAQIAEREKEMLDGLRKRGFGLTFSPGGSGLFRKYITDGGGYYIDVGCSKLIVDGKVGFLRCEGGIKEVVEKGVVLADGREVVADVIVCATGYQNMNTTVENVMGKQIAERTKEVWNLDDEGEVRAIWRPSGHPNFWFMGGNLALCRHYSKLLALQIVGVERGFNKQVP